MTARRPATKHLTTLSINFDSSRLLNKTQILRKQSLNKNVPNISWKADSKQPRLRRRSRIYNKTIDVWKATVRIVIEIQSLVNTDNCKPEVE